MSQVISPIVPQIKQILSDNVLEGTPPENLEDADLASLDSIGRLSLMVELENTFTAELMGDEFEEDSFESFDKLASYIERRRSA